MQEDSGEIRKELGKAMDYQADAAQKVEWIVAVLKDTRLYAGLILKEASERLGRKSPSFVGDFEDMRNRATLANTLALCDVYEVKLQFILNLYDQRKKVTKAATRRWLNDLDVEAIGFDEPGRKDLIRGIERSGTFCLRVAVGTALMDEYPHIQPLQTLAFMAVVEDYDWKFSI